MIDNTDVQIYEKTNMIIRKDGEAWSALECSRGETPQRMCCEREQILTVYPVHQYIIVLIKLHNFIPILSELVIRC
jgi:hypothetical protein